MIDPMIDEMTDYFHSNNFDYVSNTVERTFPDGLDIEIFSFNSLKKAHEMLQIKSQRTCYLYINSKKTNLKMVISILAKLNERFEQIRITLDTIDDLILINNVHNKLPKNYAWKDILKLIEDNKDLFHQSYK